MRLVLNSVCCCGASDRQTASAAFISYSISTCRPRSRTRLPVGAGRAPRRSLRFPDLARPRRSVLWRKPIQAKLRLHVGLLSADLFLLRQQYPGALACV